MRCKAKDRSYQKSCLLRLLSKGTRALSNTEKILLKIRNLREFSPTCERYKNVTTM